MWQEPKFKINWIYLGGLLLICFLLIDVIILTIENKELTTRIKNIGEVGRIEPLKPGERVGGFKIQTLGGIRTELAFAEQTKKYLLFIITTTCPYCEKNLEQWNAISSENNNDVCTIIGVSLHDVEKTMNYVIAKPIKFYVVSNADTGFQRRYKISAVPVTILINFNNTVEQSWRGVLTEEQMDEIRKCMKS